MTALISQIKDIFICTVKLLYSRHALQRTPLYSGHRLEEPNCNFLLKFTTLQRTHLYSGHLFRESMVSAIVRFHCISYYLQLLVTPSMYCVVLCILIFIIKYCLLLCIYTYVIVLLNFIFYGFYVLDTLSIFVTRFCMLCSGKRIYENLQI